MSNKKLFGLYRLFHKRHNSLSGGSITVEAAFIMPIVVFTVFAIIYLAFYLHDYCRLQDVSDLVLHKAAISVKHEADIITGKVNYEAINKRGVLYLITGNTKEEENQIIRYLQQELAGGLFITKISSLEAKAGKLCITVSIEAKAKVTLPLFQGLFDRLAYIKIENNYPTHNPAETIRCTEVILDTGSSIKGVEDLKEKLEDFMGSR